MPIVSVRKGKTIVIVQRPTLRATHYFELRLFLEQEPDSSRQVGMQEVGHAKFPDARQSAPVLVLASFGIVTVKAWQEASSPPTLKFQPFKL